MPTYYEMLKLTPAATAGEIEAAIEALYHQWQSLVTHHDPDIVNKANQALGFLERARATLLDPSRRAAYDASLGVQGLVGGLVNPQAKPKIATPLPPKLPTPSSVASAAASPDTWICPKCHAPNVRKMPYCPQCGEEVAHQCPKCGELIERAAQFCSHCGVDVQIHKVTQRSEVLREQLQMERRHLDYLQRRYNKVILLPKTQEEWSWQSEFAEYGTKFDTKQAIVIALLFAVMIMCSIVGFQIGGIIDPRGADWREPPTGAEIGAVLGAFLAGPIIGGIVGVYVGYNIGVRPKVKTRLELCKANTAQLEHQIQNLGVGLPLPGD